MHVFYAFYKQLTFKSLQNGFIFKTPKIDYFREKKNLFKHHKAYI